MAKRYGEEDVPRRTHGGSRADREPRQERDSGERSGGHYGMGGAERGYNMGGYGGMESYEQGYRPGSYDRLLDVTERYYGYGDEEYGLAREEDELYWYEQDQRQRSERPSGKAPKGYTRSDDRIREDICERLMHSPYDASEVEITVSDGDVTLTGTVHNRADKWGIEDVAEVILGVQEIQNQIRISREGAQASGVTLGGDTGHMDS